MSRLVCRKFTNISERGHDSSVDITHKFHTTGFILLDVSKFFNDTKIVLIFLRHSGDPLGDGAT